MNIDYFWLGVLLSLALMTGFTLGVLAAIRFCLRVLKESDREEIADENE